MKFTLEHVALRRTSENEPFPWLLKLVTLVEVARDGSVQQAKTEGEKRALLGAARDGDLVLAAWPGEWSQDIFVVDDLRAARIALGLPRSGITETSTPTDPRITGRGPDREFTLEPRLWERLANVATLPPEGQRQVAHQYPSAVEALLQRSDLDPQVRARVIDDLPSWSAATVVEAGNLATTEVVQILDRFPDSASLLVAALRHPDTAEIAQHRVGELSYDAAANIWVHERSGSDLVGGSVSS